MNLSTLEELLEKNSEIYRIPDDRLYSVDDMIYNHQKFIKQYFNEFAESDLIISMAWYLALVNRFHILLPDLLWRRYSYKCPRCLEIPCNCGSSANSSHKTGRPPSRKPESLKIWQEIMEKIYPNDGIDYLKTESQKQLEELNSAFRLFLREKKKSQFKDIEIKITDYFALVLRIFNSKNTDFLKLYNRTFSDGCYVCKKIPCECNYYE